MYLNDCHEYQISNFLSLDFSLTSTGTNYTEESFSRNNYEEIT